MNRETTTERVPRCFGTPLSRSTAYLFRDRGVPKQRVMALLFAALLLASCAVSRAEDAGKPEELFRIRVTNSTGGTVEVSLDRGGRYLTLGQVTKPAYGTIVSFGAAGYAPDSSVAATSVHGLRVKVAQLSGQTANAPMTFSIVPQEFGKIPKGYGGHEAGSSGIYTDIPAGTAVFRTFAPFAGSRIYLQRSGALEPLASDYKPAAHDVYVIVVERPAKWPSAIEFENRKGGAVTVVYPDGKREEITKVISPVPGVGRFDGTSYTGVGLVNTNHGGVITISTAPISDSSLLEGDGPERRGGFMIQPSYHSRIQPCPPNQVMIVGPENPAERVLEGKPPLFSGFVGLAYDPMDHANSCRAQVRIDGGDWENVPTVVGKVDNAFLPAWLTAYYGRLGQKRVVKTGVTHIRLLFPRLDKAFLTAQAGKYRTIYANTALSAAGGEAVSGTVTINAAVKNNAPLAFVSIFLDGQPAGISNTVPYSYSWDTTRYDDGPHTIDVRGSDETGRVVTSKITRVVVKNGR